MQRLFGAGHQPKSYPPLPAPENRWWDSHNHVSQVIGLPSEAFLKKPEGVNFLRCSVMFSPL
jgi:hypothetical protein